MIDPAMHLVFHCCTVSQASYYPYTVSGKLAYVLINETTYLPLEVLSITVWKSENAIVKVCHLTSAYFKSLLVELLFSPLSSFAKSAWNLAEKWHLAVIRSPLHEFLSAVWAFSKSCKSYDPFKLLTVPQKDEWKGSCSTTVKGVVKRKKMENVRSK